MTTSFQAFKFIELYSLIQFFSIMMMYAIDVNLTNNQFLYIDLVALVPLAIFQATTGSYQKLSKEVPTSSLFYAPVVISVLVAGLIQLAFLAFFFINVRRQPFYEPPYNAGGGSLASERIVSYEDTVIFMVSNFQYISTCLAFSKGKPFRKSFYTNLLYTVSVAILIVINASFVLVPWKAKGFIYWDFFKMLPCPGWYRWGYVATGIALNTLLTFGVEYFIISTCVMGCADRRKARKK